MPEAGVLVGPSKDGCVEEVAQSRRPLLKFTDINLTGGAMVLDPLEMAFFLGGGELLDYKQQRGITAEVHQHRKRLESRIVDGDVISFQKHDIVSSNQPCRKAQSRRFLQQPVRSSGPLSYVHESPSAKNGKTIVPPFI